MHCVSTPRENNLHLQTIALYLLYYKSIYDNSILAACALFVLGKVAWLT
jgi:hypothetical protein